jgi:tripartite-type tricarboxylate transporter receptor subunit TctC
MNRHTPRVAGRPCGSIARRGLLAALCGIGLTLAGALPSSHAQTATDYPQKPVRLVVPYATGGLPDTMARTLGQRLADDFGQQFVIDNRPGAGGVAGCELVARAQPDGYTLLVGDVGQTSINPFLFRNLPYDPVRDYAPVSLLGFAPLFLLVNPSVPANTFPELVALIKAHPGQYTYGSSGSGSVHHLAVEALKHSLGLDILHVPFKGTGQSVPAFLGGQVSMIYSALPAIASHVKSGKVKLIATSTLQRSPQAPDVPAVAEFAGLADYDYPAEIGLLAPTGTPPAVIARLNAAIVRALRHPEVKGRFANLGIDPVGGTPEAYSERIRTGAERYGRLVKIAGVRAD